MSNFNPNSDIARDLEGIFIETRHLSNTQYADDTELLKQQTVVYDRIPRQKHPKTGIPVEFITGGTVETGYKQCRKYRTAILNFADAITPGGLVLVGGTTQEENICRCSNLYEGLTIGECMKDYYRANARTFGSVYLDRIIYSADVTVFRDDETYKEIKPRKMDVITCPAPSCHISNALKALNIYEKRIENIVKSAILNDAECLVLGAWGCGAFHQDPYLIARAFCRVLNKYSGAFKRVVFAFRPTPHELTRGTTHTVEAFKKEFEKYKWGVRDAIR